MILLIIVSNIYNTTPNKQILISFILNNIRGKKRKVPGSIDEKEKDEFDNSIVDNEEEDERPNSNNPGPVNQNPAQVAPNQNQNSDDAGNSPFFTNLEVYYSN